MGFMSGLCSFALRTEGETSDENVPEETIMF